MPNVLEETGLESDALDATMTAEEERVALAQLQSRDVSGDLSDGGMVGNAKLTPYQGGVPQEKGRPVARRAWMWNGTESLLPLAWNPDGTVHDGARKYLLKRHCLCCKASGFRGRCPDCIRSKCQFCQGSTVKEKVIPCFYLRKEDVPFPERFYGNINCFLHLCPRRDGRGFKTQEDMRIHARTRHRMEYQAHLDTLAANRVDELEELKRQVAALTGTRTPKAVGTPEAPLYVKEPKK